MVLWIGLFRIEVVVCLVTSTELVDCVIFWSSPSRVEADVDDFLEGDNPW